MRALASLTLIPLVLGCGAGGDDDIDAAVSVPMAEAGARFGVAYCDRLLECSALGIALLSQTTCELAAWTYENDQLAWLDAWVAGGTLAYDGQAMADCLAEIAARPCPELSSGIFTDVGRCGAALRGLVPSGGGCDDTLQCEAGLFCDTAAGCPGTCQPRVAAGVACLEDVQCVAGLDCAGGTCQAFGRDGASCGASGLPACALGFECDPAAPRVCRPLVFTATDGASCNPGAGQLCGPGLVCALVSDPPATYQCQAPATAGGACLRAVPSACPSGQVCVVASGEVAGTCVTQASAGQPCVTGSGLLFGCAAGLTCDTVTDTCVAFVDNGAACIADAQCTGTCDGTCTPPPACD